MKNTKLQRGMIASMIDPEGFLVESFRMPDGRIESIAFVNGLPIPYNVFSMMMARRMGPVTVGKTLGAMPEAMAAVDKRLASLWKGLQMRPEDMEHRKSGDHYAATVAVTDLYHRQCEKGTAAEQFEMFVEMLDRAEETYQSSLNPVPESEAFDLYDDGFVVDEFRNNALDGGFNVSPKDCL